MKRVRGVKSASRKKFKFERRCIFVLPAQVREVHQENSFGYDGSASGRLYYYRARYFNPELSRFISQDPIGFGGGINQYSYVEGNPVSLTDPLGLWAWGDPLPQGVVDFSAGFGDTISIGITDWIRDQSGTNGSVNKCSDAYSGGTYAGYGVGAGIGGAGLWRGYSAGAEISLGRNFRMAPFGNRTGHPTGQYPHYHRRGVDSSGETLPGQGIGRHRPWDTRSTDRSFGDRF